MEISDNSNTKKIPSYRKAENSEAVAGLTAKEKDIFLYNDNRLVEESNGQSGEGNTQSYKQKSVHSKSEDNVKQPEHESSALTSANDGSSTTPNEDEGNQSTATEETKDESGGIDNADDDTAIADNVHALKASVDQVLMNLKKEAQTTIEAKMKEFGPAMEEYKTKINEMMDKVAKVLFAEKEEIRLKAENLVYELFQEKITEQFQEQVDLWIAEASEDLDSMVADWEDKEGLNVIEIDEKLAVVEVTTKLPELHAQMETIATDILRQMPDVLPTVTKTAMEGILEHLGQFADLKFDDSEILEFDVPLTAGATFTDEKLLAAITYGRVDESDYLENESISKRDASKDEAKDQEDEAGIVKTTDDSKERINDYLDKPSDIGETLGVGSNAAKSNKNSGSDAAMDGIPETINRINGTVSDFVDNNNTNDKTTEIEAKKTFIAIGVEGEIHSGDNSKGSDEAAVAQESQSGNGNAADGTNLNTILTSADGSVNQDRLQAVVSEEERQETADQ